MIALANKTENPNEKKTLLMPESRMGGELSAHTHAGTFERRKKNEGVHLTSANEMKRVT